MLAIWFGLRARLGTQGASGNEQWVVCGFTCSIAFPRTIFFCSQEGPVGEVPRARVGEGLCGAAKTHSTPQAVTASPPSFLLTRYHLHCHLLPILHTRDASVGCFTFCSPFSLPCFGGGIQGAVSPRASSVFSQPEQALALPGPGVTENVGTLLWLTALLLPLPFIQGSGLVLHIQADGMVPFKIMISH